MKTKFRQITLPQRLALGIGLALLVSLAAFNLVMHPPVADLRLMALFLTVTALVTLLAGYAAYRSGLIGRVPSIRWALFGTYLLSSALTFVNVWLTARLMFVSEHDLLLGTVLLFFASGIAMTLGYFFTETLAGRITQLSRTARQISSSGLGVRTNMEGNDEIAELGRTFDGMLDQLEAAEHKKAELDALRRDLIAWASHDLQTPLASIRVIVEALADDMVPDEATRQRYLLNAKRDVKSLSVLIDDLFELSQLDAGGLALSLESNSLSDLVSDTLESFSALAGERSISLRGVVSPAVDPVVMDATRIGRVLSNLVGNALRHTPGGGSVVIEACRKGEIVEVSVTDDGEGIRLEDHPHLFKRFYRGEKSRSRATGGSGLGLAIAKGFVEAHGGTIAAETAAGHGSRFVLTLPASAASHN